MPTLVPDRVPTFDPASQRWHWWSTPGQPSSFRQDQEQAQAIEVVWETYDLDEGRTWVAVTPVLPGFAPFLWNISRKALWLRRPEGVWKVALPSGLRRKDTVLVQEPCEGMPRLHRRSPIHCPQAASAGDWHAHDMLTPVTLEQHDKIMLFNQSPVMVNGEPVLMSVMGQRDLPRVPPYHPLLIEPWSPPGPMLFAYHPWPAGEGLLDALVITLPNGVNVMRTFGPVADRKGQWPLFQGLAIVMGDNMWYPQHVQPVIIDGDDPVAVPS